MTAEEALAPGAPLIHEEPHEFGHAPGHVNLDGRKFGTNQLTDDVVAWGDIDASDRVGTRKWHLLLARDQEHACDDEQGQ